MGSVVAGFPIGVTVKDGIVTLSGQVDSYPQKIAAEKDAKRILGVRVVGGYSVMNKASLLLY